MGLPEHAIGVDVGGQSVKLGLVHREGALTRVRREPIDADASAEALTEQIAAAMQTLQTEVREAGTPAAAVGFVFPGYMDTERTRLEFVANLPTLNGSTILADLRSAAGIPVIFDADCNAAAYAEHHLGAGKGSARMIGVTVGTGIGAGVILNGGILRIRAHIAGSLGHVCIDPHGPMCGCGGRGCVEAFASGRALMAAANLSANGAPDSRLGQVLRKGEHLTGHALAQALADDDAMTRDLVHDAGWWLGAGIAAWHAIYKPELVTLGGGIAELGQPWLDAVREGYRHVIRPEEADTLRIERAQLGPDAGIIGAGLLALEDADGS